MLVTLDLREPVTASLNVLGRTPSFRAQRDAPASRWRCAAPPGPRKTRQTQEWMKYLLYNYIIYIYIYCKYTVHHALLTLDS